MPPKGKSQRKNKKGRGTASSSADRHHGQQQKKVQAPCDDKGNTTKSEPTGVTPNADQDAPRVEKNRPLEMPSDAVSSAVASAIAAGYVTPSRQKDVPITARTTDSQHASSTSTMTIPLDAVDAAIKAAIAAPVAWPILHQYSSSRHSASSDGTFNTDDQNMKSKSAPPQQQPRTTIHDNPPPIPSKAVDAAVNAAIAAPVTTKAVVTESSSSSSSALHENFESTPPPPPPLPKESTPRTKPALNQHHNASSPATPAVLQDEDETDMTEQSISEAIQTSMVQPPPRSVQAPIPSSQIPSMSPSPPPLPPPPSEYYRQRRQETGHDKQKRQQQQSICKIL